MALEITPGYDFTVNEVPTHNKFLQQALGLEITGIPLDRIQESIQAIVFGNISGASGAVPPAEGWLWVDPGGNRVTKWRPDLARKDIRMWSSQGGWETSRARTRGFMAGYNIFAGFHMWHGAGYVSHESRLDMDLNFSPWFVSAHAVDSPASSTRLIGRGLCDAWASTQATEVYLRTHRPGILTDLAGQFGWRILNQYDGFKPHFAGTVMGPTAGSCTVTGVGPRVAAWFVTRNLGRS